MINNFKKNLIIFIFIFIILYFLKNKQNKYVESFEICGIDNLNRRDIWVNVKKKYGEKIAIYFFPKTYVLPNEIKNIYNDKDNKQYILKKIWSWARKGV